LLPDRHPGGGDPVLTALHGFGDDGPEDDRPGLNVPGQDVSFAGGNGRRHDYPRDPVRLLFQGIDEEGPLLHRPGQALVMPGKVGGELSRLLLALKTAVAGRYRVPTLVFDEIDTGLGGRTAAAVGRKLAAIADRHQVISVTHLPQVAAFADHHFVIVKSRQPQEKKTSIQLEYLNPEDEPLRIRELARMGSGDQISRQAEDLARRLRAEAHSENTRTQEAS